MEMSINHKNDIKNINSSEAVSSSSTTNLPRHTAADAECLEIADATSDTTNIRDVETDLSISSTGLKGNISNDCSSFCAAATAADTATSTYCRPFGILSLLSPLATAMPHSIGSSAMTASVAVVAASGAVNGMDGIGGCGGGGEDAAAAVVSDDDKKSIKQELWEERSDQNADNVPSDSCGSGSNGYGVLCDSHFASATAAEISKTTTPNDLTVSNIDSVHTNNLESPSDTAADADNNSNSPTDKCTSSDNSFSIKPSDSLMLVGGSSGGKTLNDDDENGDDYADERRDLQPLLFACENERRKLPMRGIVKSPSAKSFETNGVVAADGTIATSERPVLHVQFRHNGGASSSSSGGGCVPPTSYNRDGEQNCSSPASSVSTTSSSSASDDDEDSSSGQYSEAKPPDGGWGWVVVFASFIVNLIADGITFSFGVIYVEFLNYFGEGKGKTAWIGSLFMAMPLLSGPVASFLTDRYGCRKVTIAGSILACLGFIMSAFSTSMEMLFLTFGVLAGFGLSLCYVAAVVIVAYYFDKRRSFATGLSVCGSGIGTFIFAPLTQALIEHYGWRGTTLILAGFFLNMTVCGMLMRDLEWTTHRAKLRAKARKQNKLGVSAESFSVSNSTNTGGTANNLHQQHLSSGLDNDLGCGAGLGKIDPTLNPRLFSSLITLPTFMRNGEQIPPEVLELMSTHHNVQHLMHDQPTLGHSRSFSEPLSSSRHSGGMSPPEGALSPTNPERLRYEKSKNRKIRNEQAFLTWLKRDVGPHQRVDGSNRHQPTTAYLKDLKMHRHSLTYRGAMLNINRYRLRASSCPDIYRNSMTTIAKEKIQWGQGIEEFKNLLLDMLDFSYFADTRFLLFAMSNFFLYTWYDVPYVYLADNAIELGISETDASILISFIGIVNMFGEIFLGWCGDRKYLTAGVIYAICMGLCGIVTACVPLLKTYVGLSVIAGLFGLFIAANYALTSIILVELITLERFTNAYGLLLLVQGIANLVGPPLAGWITDVTGNYDLAFYLSGFFIAVSGVLMFILPVQGKVKEYKTLRRRKSEERTLAKNKVITDARCNSNGSTTMFADCFGKESLRDGTTTQINHV